MTRLIAFVCVATVLAAVALSEMTALERYVREGARKATGAITREDLLNVFANEAAPELRDKLRRHPAAARLESWYHATVKDYPVLTTTPEQLHITVGTEPNTVVVLWTTSNASMHSQVTWWPNVSSAATSTATGTAWTYNPISLEPWTGAIHGALMSNLTAGAPYCYTVGDPVLNIFTTQPVCFVAPDLYKDTVTIAFGGDMGTVQLFGYLIASEMLAASQTTQFDAFWLLGDIAYSTLDPGHDGNLELFWDEFLRQEAPLVDHVPLLVTYGNHDYSGGDSGAFINRFRNPQNGNAGVGNFYWSYEHGPIKFVSMCTEIWLQPQLCNYTPGSAQYAWLEQQLSSVNRTRTPWLMIGGHRPMYSSDKSTDSGPLKQIIEPLIVKYGVDVQITGHMHCTELCAPVVNNTAMLDGVTKVGTSSWVFASPQAPVHITSGILGAMQSEKFVDPQPAWSLARQGGIFTPAYGFVRLVANRTALAFDAILESDGAVGDTLWSVTITK